MTTAEGTRNGILHGKHILVAEDEPAVRGALRRALEAHGCQVREAANGREAAEYARNGPVNIVITDLWMPEMNGVELIEALNAMDCRAEVIVLSAHLTASSTDKFRCLGVLRILTKPVEMTTLLDSVRGGLESDRRMRLARTVKGRRPAEWRNEQSERATVLVADDDRGARELLRRALLRAGYLVEEARDGEEAVEKALACHLDSIITDLNMPRMSGREAVEILRHASRNCFIICVTGECNRQEIDAALRAGAARCFRKPFDMAAILAELERFDLIAAHRKRLADWECTLRESFTPQGAQRRHGRRFKWMVAAAVAVVAIRRGGASRLGVDRNGRPCRQRRRREDRRGRR